MTGERVIRTRSKSGEGQEDVKNLRTAAELTDRITSSSEAVVNIAGDLQDGEIKALIDHAYSMQETAKALDETVGQIKDVLKMWGSLQKVKKLDGFRSGSMSISAKTTTTTKGATELVRLLKKFNKVKAADTILSVKIGEAKKYLGEAVLLEEKFMSQDSDPFGKISLVELKKKKK